MGSVSFWGSGGRAATSPFPPPHYKKNLFSNEMLIWSTAQWPSGGPLLG